MTKANYKPKWNRDVSPYLIVDDVDAQIEFIMSVFGAELIEAPKINGKIFHAELKIGDSVVMVGQAQSPDWPAMKGNIYMYVEDVQKVYDAGLQHGGTSVMVPTAMPWGNLDSAFDDPQHNRWWVARLTKPMDEQEITEAMDARRT